MAPEKKWPPAVGPLVGQAVIVVIALAFGLFEFAAIFAALWVVEFGVVLFGRERGWWGRGWSGSHDR